MFYFLELSAKLDVSPNDYEETHHKHQGFFPSFALKNDALQAELQGLVGHKKAEEAQQGREAEGVVGQKAGVELTSWRHRFLLQFRRQGSNHHRDSRSSSKFQN